MPNAVIYCRISKDTEEKALGVARQEKLCRTLAEQHGLEVTEVLVDNDLSAYSRKRRPGFEQLVEMLLAGGVDAIVTYHADRLYRRASDLERLVDIVETSRTQVHTVAAGNVDLTTASGRMVARMLGAAAQHESERIGERTRAKNDELAAAGKRPGGRPPYGYTKGYVVAPDEAEAVKFMADRILVGATLAQVARELDALGVPTRQGGRWRDSTVRMVLIKPAVAGLRIHRREVAGPGDWEPVLDRATWQQVRDRLVDPRRRCSAPTDFLLSGLVRNTSGDVMVGWGRYRSGGYVRQYATKNRPGEPPPRPFITIDASVLEDRVVEAVLQACDHSTLTSPSAPGAEASIVEKLEAELVELAGLRGSGDISFPEWRAARAGIQVRLREAQQALGAGPSRLLSALSKPGAVRKAWPTLDVGQQREIIEALVDHVVVLTADRGRWTTLDERLDPDLDGGIVWRA